MYTNASARQIQQHLHSMYTHAKPTTYVYTHRFILLYKESLKVYHFHLLIQSRHDCCKTHSESEWCIYNGTPLNRQQWDTVLFSEVSSFQRLTRVVLGVGKGVLFREVSSVQKCPHMERGSTVYCAFLDTPYIPGLYSRSCHCRRAW